MEQPPDKIQKRPCCTLRNLALGLVFIGLLWRVVRYLLQFPIWGDEAMLSTNFVWLDYGQLLHRLENVQIAPLLFLWGEKTALFHLGPGMLSMRLVPFLAGVGSLFLYWRLARLMLGPRAQLFAIGFLAVAIWPVSMSTLLKPYSCDLFMSLVLLLPAVKWLKNPSQTLWLVLLTALTPFVLLASYPAVFIAGGASMAMLLPAWRQGWKTRLWFVGFNVALLVGFILASRIGAAQLSTPVGAVNTQAGMSAYWAEGFPPSSPLAFVWWLVLAMTGQMTAYPMGASNGGSIVTVVFCAIGIRCWIKRGRWEWLVLLTGPVFLGIVASVIHRYPFGTSCRLNQHIAPAVCILAGLGLAAVIDNPANGAAKTRKWTLIAAGFFAVVGLGGLVRDIFHPYRDEGCKWVETTMGTVLKEVPPREPVIVCAVPQGINLVFTWYWITGWKNLAWDFQIPAGSTDGGELCGFSAADTAAQADVDCTRLTHDLQLRDPAWHLVKRVPYEYIPTKRKETGQRCELFFFARSL